MIEGLSASASATPASPAVVIAERLKARLALADPQAPTGPKPTFEVSPMDRLRESRSTELPAAPDDGSRFGGYGQPAPERGGTLHITA